MDLITKKDVKIVQKNGSQFIAWMKKYKQALSRVEGGHFMDYSTIRPSQIDFGRKPIVTPEVVHNEINKASKLIFGWKIRDGVMVSSTRDELDDNFGGKPQFFIPLNGYKYVFSPDIDDFNYESGKRIFLGFLAKYGMKIAYTDEIVDIFTEKPVREKDFFEVIKLFLKKHYKETGLENYTQYRIEISFNTREYYLIDDELIFDILNIDNFDGWGI